MNSGAGRCASDEGPSKAMGGAMAGTTARPHCLAEETATRCQRSRRALRVRAASVTSLRAVTIGWMAARPSITASRTTASILSPFSTACASVSAIGTSARGVTRLTSRTVTRALLTAATTAANSPPSPLNTASGSPAASRSTRLRCSASSAGRSISVAGSLAAGA